MTNGRRKNDRPDKHVPVREQVENGYGGFMAAVLRIGSGLITPAGLIAAVLFLANVSSQQDRNCQAVKTLDAKTDAVIKVDNELNKPQNQALRHTLVGKRVNCQ